LAALGVESGMAFFRDLGRKTEALYFPYFLGGEPVYWKARSIEGKSFTSKTGGKVCFFNLDNALRSKPETIWCTEGEADTAALVEAGLPVGAVLSVPTGAPDRPKEDDEEISGYGYVDEALKLGLSSVKRIVWCGDGDAPGHHLRAIMARLFGPARFWFVDWPEGCKDANEMLVAEGREALLDLVRNGAQPWPVSGLYRLSELPEPAPMTLWNPGFPEWEGKVRFAPGTLSVVTGRPGMGKTALMSSIWFNIIQRYELVGCFATFETRAKPHMRQRLRTLRCGKLERDMDESERADADRWINDHYLWLNHPNQTPTLSWFLDMAEISVVRHGAAVVSLDPWNRLEAQRDGRETETEYIGRALTSLYQFAQDMSVHVQVLAHPTKGEIQGRSQAPSLEDISGSSHWVNRVDQGFIVHRPHLFENGGTETQLIYQKSRFEELGYPCRLKLQYEKSKGSFRSADYDGVVGEQGFSNHVQRAE
jgi:twinkle protein